MDTDETTLYRARYILDGLEWLEDGYLGVADGRIVDVHPTQEAFGGQPAAARVVDLGEVAVVPGLVNAHSHAFQRGIRGRTEYLLAGREDEDFWTWRQQMYGAALSWDADQIEAVSKLAFLEMALSGVTSVGEFHYLHHQPDGAAYADPNELAHRIIRAARQVGLRIALLRVGYARAGYGRAAEPTQRRFVEADVDTYLERVDALQTRWADEPCVSVGLAPHSIRAVGAEWLEGAAGFAEERDLPLHIHACEQRREIEESHQEYGLPPVAAFADLSILSERMTLVHGTHLSDDELDLLADARPTICACPTTERNLGDGFLPALELTRRQVPICLGSDSHTNIDLWEEMRLVEYHERLRYERRNVLAACLSEQAVDDDHKLPTAHALWPMGTANGARSLDVKAGRIEPGFEADFVTLDLDHITLVGADADSLLADITLSMTPAAVRDVFVAGKRIVQNGRHELASEIKEGLVRKVRRG